MNMSDSSGANDYNEWSAPEFNINKPSKGAGTSIKNTPPTVDEIKKVYDQSHHEGFNEGYSEGLEKAKSEIEEKINIINNIISMLNSPLENLSTDVADKLKEMSILIASQIIRREITIDHDSVMSSVTRSIELLKDNTNDIYIHLNPLDVQIVKGIISIEPGGNINFRDDPSITRGGCKVLSNSSTIDATIEEQIINISSNIIGGSRADDS